MATMKANQIMNGSYGAVWVDNEKLSNVKSFEAKVELKWEELDIAEDLGTHQKFMGYSGSGTMTLHKVDSFMLNKLKDGIAKGVIPELMIVAKLDDPAALGAERVQFNEVTVDELTLMKFEQKALGEEEVPFKFASFTVLDTVK